MIYTVGHKESYLQYFTEQEKPIKLGKCILEDGEPYQGGIAFKTVEEAKEFLIKNNKLQWAVFGLKATWNKDVYLCDQGFYALLADTELVLLND